GYCKTGLTLTHSPKPSPKTPLRNIQKIFQFVLYDQVQVLFPLFLNFFSIHLPPSYSNLQGTPPQLDRQFIRSHWNRGRRRHWPSENSTL
ncbi:hypothetical protein BDFB_015114, partial [Asbolus verrucosus]